MSLPHKVTLYVVLTFLLSGLLSYAIQQFFIMPSFITLEKETTTQNGERIIAAINRELEQIGFSVADWAYWTDTYNYVIGEYPDYPAEYLEETATFESLNVNFIGIYNTAGKSIWSRGIDLETGEKLKLGHHSEGMLCTDYPQLQPAGLESEIRGIINTHHAPMLIVGRNILRNDLQGPIVGTLVMGRFLDDKAIKRIGDLTQLSLVAERIDAENNQPNLGEISHSHHGLNHSDFIQVKTKDSWKANTMVADIFGTPIMSFSIETPRDISKQGAKAVAQSLWTLAATGLLVMLLLWIVLHHSILTPMAKLTKHALLIGQNDFSRTRLNYNRGDEIGILARTFDKMIDQLADTRSRLIDQSYHSGIAEMASGVLHNIGNALTPLNIRLSSLQQELRTAPVNEIHLAVGELADPSTPAERRKDLKRFLELAGTEMAVLIKKSKEQIDSSVQQVSQVQEILKDQYRVSNSSRVIEPIDMVPIIQDMGADLDPELRDTLRIKITPSVAESGNVSGSRAALQQVVSNILINAAESIHSAGSNPGHITVTAEQKETKEQTMVHLRFVDNGVGIKPEDIGRLFEKGFSTKKQEGRGYGLHWCANTIQALKGKFSIESSGPGNGACIHLLLPLADNLPEKF